MLYLDDHRKAAGEGIELFLLRPPSVGGMCLKRYSPNTIMLITVFPIRRHITSAWQSSPL